MKNPIKNILILLLYAVPFCFLSLFGNYVLQTSLFIPLAFLYLTILTCIVWYRNSLLIGVFGNLISLLLSVKLFGSFHQSYSLVMPGLFSKQLIFSWSLVYAVFQMILCSFIYSFSRISFKLLPKSRKKSC